MRSNFFSLLFLILTSFCFSQQKDIKLPKSEGFEIKYPKNTITPILSVYINKKEEVFLEDIKIDSLPELGNYIIEHRSKLDPSLVPFVLMFLHADSELKYSIIDKIKSELSSAYVWRVFYRTNHIEDITQGVGLRNQAALSYRKSAIKIDTLDSNVEFIEVIDLIKKHPIEELRDDLYALNFELVKTKLSKYKYKKMEFFSENELKIGDKLIKLSNEEEIFNELKDLDVYFISSNKELKYGDYLKTISTITKLYRAKKRSIPYIELSFELIRILKKKGITL
ncbi:MAG: hypothetical protein JXR05_05735 [Flavobacteriaceae bacterium]